MLKLKTLIVEDDPTSLKKLNDLLKEFIPAAVVVGEAGSIDEALLLLKNQKPQLILLNTELQGESGFQILEKAGKINFEIVFITSNEGHALEAYNYPAADFLLKPLTPELIKRGFSRALDRFYSMKTYNDNPMLMDFELKIPNGKAEKIFQLEHVIRLEANRSYSWVITTNEPPYLAAKHMAALEEILTPRQFIRVHVSHLVNTRCIKQFHPSENLIEMKDGSRVPVSRDRKTKLKAVLLQYVTGQVSKPNQEVQ
jgi:two-component system LytT family response regulator